MTAKAVRFLPIGALGAYSVSCVTMATVSAVALAVALGVSGAGPLSTPLDGFLRVWGLPLSVLSVAALLWTIRQRPRLAIGSVGLGGALTVAGMLAMPSSTDGGGSSSMAGMGAHPASLVATWEVALVFWTGAALVAFGYLWSWRSSRGKLVQSI